jgi:hypothetical protein
VGFALCFDLCVLKIICVFGVSADRDLEVHLSHEIGRGEWSAWDYVASQASAMELLSV